MIDTENLVFNLRMSTPDDMHLPVYDNTKLVAMNTCPTWGILRYQMHRTLPGSGRAMALEAGTVMHEVFAMIRLLTLFSNNHHENIPEIVKHHLIRIFKDRGGDLYNLFSDGEIGDIYELANTAAIQVIETSGFYDDPSDRRRTINNLILCASHYIQHWDFSTQIWVRDLNNPTSDIGVEIAFDTTAELHHLYGSNYFRLTGIIDGISVSQTSEGQLIIEENKTASRLGDAWSMPFHINSQPTIYLLAASAFTKQEVNHARIIGLAIPIPKSSAAMPMIVERVTRKIHHYQDFVAWLFHTIDMYERYQDNPHAAPRFTHSCNRYFRPCSFIPFCDADPEEQKQMIENDFVENVWTPLEAKVNVDE